MSPKDIFGKASSAGAAGVVAPSTSAIGTAFGDVDENHGFLESAGFRLSEPSEYERHINDAMMRVVQGGGIRQIVYPGTIEKSEYAKMITAGSLQRTPLYQSQLNTDINDPMARAVMLAIRMRLNLEQLQRKFQQITTLMSGDGKTVNVVYAGKNQLVMLEDSADMFPSDTLITQLRIMDTE